MKKLLLLIGIVFLFSCEKLEPCKTCTTVTTCLFVDTITTTEDLCGAALRKIDGKTTSIIMNGYTFTSKTTCK